jgi:hypothetical protein
MITEINICVRIRIYLFQVSSHALFANALSPILDFRPLFIEQFVS